MRIRRKDLDLLAEAYGSIGQPQASSTTDLHPALVEIEDEVFDGVPKVKFHKIARKVLGRRYSELGEDQIVEEIGNLLKCTFNDDGDSYTAAEDLRTPADLEAYERRHQNDEDAEGFAPQVKIDIRDTEDLEIEGIDRSDYPDFSDAYFSKGYLKGREEPLTDEELEYLTDKYPEELNSRIHDHYLH